MIQKRTLIGILLAAVLLGTIPALGIAAPSPSQLVQEGDRVAKEPWVRGHHVCPRFGTWVVSR